MRLLGAQLGANFCFSPLSSGHGKKRAVHSDPLGPFASLSREAQAEAVKRCLQEADSQRGGRGGGGLVATTKTTSDCFWIDPHLLKNMLLFSLLSLRIYHDWTFCLSHFVVQGA